MLPIRSASRFRLPLLPVLMRVRVAHIISCASVLLLMLTVMCVFAVLGDSLTISFPLTSAAANEGTPISLQLTHQDVSLTHTECECMQRWYRVREPLPAITAISGLQRTQNTSTSADKPDHLRVRAMTDAFASHMAHAAQEVAILWSVLRWHKSLGLPQIQHVQFVNEPGEWAKEIIEKALSWFNVSSWKYGSGMSTPPKGVSTLTLIRPSQFESYVPWFLHPSDAVSLTSLLLHGHPCGCPTNNINPVDTKTLTVTVMDRRESRRILQLEAAMKAIHDYTSEAGYTTRVTHFFVEDSPLMCVCTCCSSLYNVHSCRFQAGQMESSDVVVAIHGQALTNIMFMKPCSIVIEVDPLMYFMPSFFGGLAIGSGILHYSWEETSNMLNVLAEDPVLAARAAGNDTGACLSDVRCRARARHRDVPISPWKLRMALSKSLLDRDKCLMQHPYWQRSDSP